MKRQYVHVEGSHVSDQDAENIGLAIEQLEKKLGRSASIEEFAKAVKSKSNPAHTIVTKKCKAIMSRAWREASEYCLRSVDVIEIIGDEKSAPQKAYFLLDLSTTPNYPSSDSVVMSLRDVQKDDRAIDFLEERFRRIIRSAVNDFADIAGTKRAAEVIKEEMVLIVKSRNLEANPSGAKPDAAQLSPA
jgi:hypothetical protein